MQKAVVNEAKALSALENAAASSPRKNITPSTAGSSGLCATRAKSLSPVAVMPWSSAKSVSSIPNERNMRFTKIKVTPSSTMFFCAFLSLLTVRFFCIMSWSNPVMAIAINIPPSTCFQPAFEVPLWKKYQSLCEVRYSEILTSAGTTASATK